MHPVFDKLDVPLRVCTATERMNPRRLHGDADELLRFFALFPREPSDRAPDDTLLYTLGIDEARPSPALRRLMRSSAARLATILLDGPLHQQLNVARLAYVL